MYKRFECTLFKGLRKTLQIILARWHIFISDAKLEQNTYTYYQNVS